MPVSCRSLVRIRGGMARRSRESALRVSSAAEPPGITETDKFLFTYLGHRSPVIPLGHLFRPHPADTSRLLTMMALGTCALRRMRNYSGHSGLRLQPIQGRQQEGVAVLHARTRRCPGKAQCASRGDSGRLDACVR